ncbi:uncharacterized protein LOC127248118 [Andrographis paniculata]|uniref:uncharacterized protein LOC127248118 n=1 Tax=Andrographis paniculata TaxID=175694 RepID=UPI0021E86D28|nr:uncharacterized protein LOC127248118 [Andrographis paniculata]XP_051126261.1 uncharacterized protein LOC127248118 [Andrographis paniculata]
MDQVLKLEIESMACNKMHRRFSLHRKLQILRTLTKSKSVKKSSVVMDACLYIHKLKLQIEAIRKECQHLINHVQEVQVEKIEEGCLSVRVSCKNGNNGQELLPSILEAFEEMEAEVVEARITTAASKHCLFGMEAIVRTAIDADLFNHTLQMIVRRQTLDSDSI